MKSYDPSLHLVRANTGDLLIYVPEFDLILKMCLGVRIGPHLSVLGLNDAIMGTNVEILFSMEVR